MLRNSRPGTFFGDWDLEWKGSTRTERKLAQNQYDIQEQLETLNNRLNNVNTSDREDTYIDYALLAQVDRNEVTKYMNKYNQQVVSETPSITKIIKEENDANYKIISNDSGRSSAKTMSYMCIPLAFIFGIFGCVTASLSFATSVCVLIGGVILWIILTNVYATLRYGTKEQDEKELDRVVNKKVMSSTYKKFREFRIKHYNHYMEELINEYTVDIIKLYYIGKGDYKQPRNDIIPKSEIMAYGTSEDYMNYLRENFEE